MGLLDAPQRGVVSGRSGIGGIAGLGDSITANGVSGSGQDITLGRLGTITPRNWIMWASVLSGGRLQYAGVAATGGYTTQQIIDVHLPRMLVAVRAGRVSTVAVLAGTNDIGAGVPVSTIATNLATIYKALARAGAHVVACTLTPRESAPGIPDIASFRNALQRLNAWILLASCRFNNVSSLDMHARTATTDGIFVSGYNQDNVHPNSAGAKAMGGALAEHLIGASPLMRDPVLANTSTDTGSGGYSTFGNPLMTDTNADGTPDGVTTQGSPAMSTNTTGVGLRGRYCKAVVSQTASSSVVQFGNSLIVAPGDLVLVAARIRSAVESVGGNIDFRVVSNPSESTVVAELAAWDRDIPDGSVISFVASIPEMGAETAVKAQAKVRLGIGASVEVAQLIGVNMTSVGIEI